MSNIVPPTVNVGKTKKLFEPMHDVTRSKHCSLPVAGEAQAHLGTVAQRNASLRPLGIREVLCEALSSTVCADADTTPKPLTENWRRGSPMNGRTQNNKLGVMHQTQPRISARADDNRRALAPVSTTVSNAKGKSARSPGSETLNECSRTVSS